MGFISGNRIKTLKNPAVREHDAHIIYIDYLKIQESGRIVFYI